MRRLRALAAATAAVVAAGCIAVPRSVEYYDPGCNIVARKMVLDSVQVNGVLHCTHNDCVAVVLGVSAASVIVSGSIVVAGNTVYWLEKQGKCVEARLR